MPLQILNKWYKVESQEINNVIKTPSINYWEFVEGFVLDNYEALKEEPNL